MTRRLQATTIVPAAVGFLYLIALLFIFRPHGIAITEDGVGLIGTARNVVAGHGFLDYVGSPMTFWPPLFPALVAGLVELGLADFDAALAVNLAAAAATMFIATRWLLQTVDSTLLIVFGVAAVAVSVQLLDILSEVRTDPLFVALCLGSLAALGGYLAGGRERGFRLGILLTALACLTRYHGVFLLFTWCLFVLWKERAAPLKAVLRSGIFAVLAAAPMAAWMGRNLAVSGTLTGPRPLSVSFASQLQETVARIADSVSLWFLPLRIPMELRLVLLAILLGLLGVLASILLRRCLQDGPEQRAAALRILPLLAFAGIYTLLTILAAAGTAAWGVHRYMYVVYVPLVVVACFALDRLDLLAASRSEGGAASRRLPLKAMATALVLLWLVIPADRFLFEVGRIAEGKPDYFNLDRYRASTVIDHLARNPVEGFVLSNEPALVYIRTGIRARYVMTEAAFDELMAQGADEARRAFVDRATRPTQLLKFEAAPIYLVWMRVNPNERVPPEKLEKLFHLAALQAGPEATLYRIEAGQ